MRFPSSQPASSEPLGGEPPIAGQFLLEIDGVDIGIFREVSGLELTVSVETYNEGGQNGFSHKLPGRMSWPNLVFKRGITDSDALFAWVNKSSGEGFSANSNALHRSTGAVTLLSYSGKRLRSWSIRDAFPVRWTGPRLSAEDMTAVEEELEIAHHGFTSKTTV